MSASKAELFALRVAAHLGLVIADARRRRQLTLRELAARTGLAASSIHAIEHGRPAEITTYAAIAAALDLELRLDLVDPRKRASTAPAEDPVHAAMGETIATRLVGHGIPIGIDEPYQHFQFAGRADLLAWDLDRRSILHVENRTRFPNVQEAIGSYNAKRRYLPAVVAERLGLRGGFLSVTNVIAGLWSAEVLHSIRIRSASFRAVARMGSPPSRHGGLGQPLCRARRQVASSCSIPRAGLRSSRWSPRCRRPCDLATAGMPTRPMPCVVAVPADGAVWLTPHKFLSGANRVRRSSVGRLRC